jgi:peptidoglycan/LPS O-acetylase OafA/YrhL
VSVQEAPVAYERFLPSGEEAGTAPDDRAFRPDVEGLRAVAVLLVVLYHANVAHLTGGYVGVDVFFVISGFVITGLLLRERQRSGRTSIIDFYARRCRRILPAATVVILATVLATYAVLGVVTGNATADDGRWAAAFLANFHFESIGTNYLTASRPPSPLQNYWSLSVEEQFYLVYPTLFLLVAGAKRLATFRVRIAVALVVVIVASYWLSVAQTASNPSLAYFSPLTRAWELALGALVAVGTTWLRRLPRPAAAALTWGGLAAVLAAGFAFDAETAYPGSLVAIPVVGAALILAGGAAVPSAGAESLLGTRPFQWFGRRSYSLYLWHWPLLIIAAERVGKTSLPVGESLLLVLVAVVISAASYRLVENPLRHLRLASRTSVLAGLTLLLTTIVVLSVFIAAETANNSDGRVVPVANEQVLLGQVAAAPRITRVPASIRPALSTAPTDWGGAYESLSCTANASEVSEPICPLGDPNGSRLMVLYGDSRAAMWLPAFEAMARAAHWRLVLLNKTGCPASPVTIAEGPTEGSVPGAECDRWHTWATQWINAHRPSLLVFSQSSRYYQPGTDGGPARIFSAGQWSRALQSLFASIKVPNARMVYLGGTPDHPQTGPQCLAAHTTDVQYCGAPAKAAVPPYNTTDQAAARAAGVDYVDPTPWFCTGVCSPIIANYEVYIDGLHITATWAKYLQNVVADALGIARPGRQPQSG